MHVGQPTEKEQLIDWAATIRKSVERDLKDAGGTDALMLMSPSAEYRSELPADDTELLRRTKFGHLDDESFRVAQAMWRSAGLDPWSEQFHVRLQFDSTTRRNVVKLILNIEGIRARAHGTGCYAGHKPVEVVYTEEGLIPTSCTFTVLRRSGDHVDEYPTTVLWAEYYGNDPERWQDVVAQFPRVCLERCAEALALRRAFPEIAQVYTPEEFFRQDRQHRVAAKTFPTPQPMLADQIDDIQIPESTTGLHLALIDLGLSKPADRESLLKEVSRGMERIDGDDKRFYVAVIRAARQRQLVTA